MKAAILLAAGSSSRMGESKQLLIVENQPLLRKMVLTLLESKFDMVCVVLGHNAELHQSVISDLNTHVVVNNHWDKGMGSSIKTGISHLLVKGQPDCIGVFVCDQPKLTTPYVNLLMEEFDHSEHWIVASSYQNTIGVPAVFDHRLFDVLLHMEDGQGAKQIIQEHEALLKVIRFDLGSVDLDTPNDYKAFLEGD